MLLHDFTYPWMVNGVLVAELEVRVAYSYSPATRAYFDRGYGNWLPGDDAEIEVECAWLLEVGSGNRNPKQVPVPDNMEADILEYAHVHCQEGMTSNAIEDAYDRQCDAADARRDWMRDEGRAAE